MKKHLHNVVECPLTQMRNQGSCFQINAYCFKEKLNGKQCSFCCTPLPSSQFSGLVFGLIFQVLLVSFTPTYVFSYFWLKINSILSVSSCVTSYSLQWILEINSISVLLVLPPCFSNLKAFQSAWDLILLLTH